MDNHQVEDGIIPLSGSQRIEEMKLQFEHAEKTIWNKDLHWTWAKAAVLISTAIVGATGFLYAVFRGDVEMLKTMAPIISGILAFVGAKFC